MDITTERPRGGQKTGTLLIVILAAAGGFLILRAITWHMNVERSCVPFETCPALSMKRALIGQLRSWEEWAPPFLALTVIGIALAERGWRRLFVLPAASLVLLPRLLGSHPEALAGTLSPSPMVGAGAVAALATIGGAVVADRVRRRVVRPRWTDVGAFGVCTAALGVGIWVRAVRGDHPLAGQDTAMLVALFLFGAGSEMRRPWFPWAYIAVPLMLSQGNAGQWWWRTPSTWSAAIPFLAVVFLGALRRPLATWLARLQRRPLEGLFVFQALNIADAVLTGFGLARGTVEEANPVARLIGMPAKVVVGGVAGWLLLRRRPKLLLVPTVVLLGVFAYHIGGLMVNA